MKGDRGRSSVRIPRLIRSEADATVKPPVRSEGVDTASQTSSASAEPPRPAEPKDLHTRIVVPRQGRISTDGASLPEIELREIRYGAVSRGPYLRVLRHQPFKRPDGGHLQATIESSRPRGRLERAVAIVKRAALGTPFATSRLIHERLTKVRALGVFSSDPLSSAAYSAEEIMLVLLLAGTDAFI